MNGYGYLSLFCCHHCCQTLTLGIVRVRAIWHIDIWRIIHDLGQNSAWPHWMAVQSDYVLPTTLHIVFRILLGVKKRDERLHRRPIFDVRELLEGVHLHPKRDVLGGKARPNALATGALVGSVTSKRISPNFTFLTPGLSQGHFRSHSDCFSLISGVLCIFLQGSFRFPSFLRSRPEGTLQIHLGLPSVRETRFPARSREKFARHAN